MSAPEAHPATPDRTTPDPSTTDPAGPEPVGVSTGMATGSDEGAPGDHASPEPLDDTEQTMLRTLQDDDAPEVVQPIEDDAAATVAAENDSVLPVGRAGAVDQDGGRVNEDGDEPEFLAPS